MSEMIDGQIVAADAAGSNYVPIVAAACTPMTAPAYSPIAARVPIHVRPAVMGDLAFIDRMQKAHSKELGFLPTAALEGKVRLGQVLVAELVDSEKLIVDSSESGSSSSTINHQLSTINSFIGYLIAADRYQKRDEIGYVTQINVVPEYRRSLVAAQLLQAQFDRSAYGCRLYCCWCAQDLKANEFWEAMGFTAIAFRTGSMKRMRNAKCGMRNEDRTDIPHSAFRVQHSSRARVHIFWQKRIRAGDSTTPWWYPSQTGGGELREDRLVFPIMPGVHWREVGPIVLGERGEGGGERKIQDAGSASSFSPLSPPPSPLSSSPSPLRKKRSKAAEPVVAKPPVGPRARGGFWAPEQGVPDTFKTQKQLAEETRAMHSAKHAAPKPKRAAKRGGATGEAAVEATKIDPRLIAMSRELRDQWAERAETIVSPGAARHDVKRIAQPSTVATITTAMPLRLEAA